MKIISISGLDGSGKSTQAKMLQDFLESHNRKVYYFHAVQFSFPQRLKALKDKLCKKTAKVREEKSVTKANWLQIQLRKLALVIDVLRFKLLKRKLAKDGYQFMVTDRFFYDSVVNLAYLMHKNTPPRCEKYIPHADAAFYLKIEPEAIMTRERVPDQGLDYLKAKKKLYDMYSLVWDLKIIDGSAQPQILFEKLLAEITNKKV